MTVAQTDCEKGGIARRLEEVQEERRSAEEAATFRVKPMASALGGSENLGRKPEVQGHLSPDAMAPGARPRNRDWFFSQQLRCSAAAHLTPSPHQTHTLQSLLAWHCAQHSAAVSTRFVAPWPGVWVWLVV